MPIYEYQCTSCGEKFEVMQSMGADGSELKCPKCNTKNPRRLLSAFFAGGSSTSGFSDTSCPTCDSGVCNLPPME
jgi:putative FmdB family regulatory protein